VRASHRLLLFAVPAILLASADLIVKASVPTAWWAFHHRSDAWVALGIGVLVGACALTLVPSRAVALAAGVATGGVLGNLVSASMNGNRVPNPLVIGGYGHGIAFNLADVFILFGNALLMSALIVTAVRHRHRFAPPRAWERAVLRQLGLGS
jgi:lipoprotein signal peptidase